VDFYRPAHETIFDTMVTMSASGESIDMVTVAERLQQSGDLQRIGGAPCLHTLAAEVPMAANAVHYADLITDAAVRRRITEAGTAIAQRGYSGTGNADDLADHARRMVDAITDGINPTDPTGFGDILTSVLDIAENGMAARIPTAWRDVDRLLGGLEPGRLAVVAARPGVGKSLFCLNQARKTASTGKAVLFASLEMEKWELGQRLLADAANINLSNLRGPTESNPHATLSEAEWQKIAHVTPALQALPLEVDDDPNQTVPHIRRAARNLQRAHTNGKGPELGLIVVDYLQLVTPVRTGKDASNRAAEVGEISRGLKLLARECGVPVLAAAQLNREGHDAPTLRNLRESGSIENDADQVVLLHRPDLDQPDLEALVPKNRGGATGQAHLLLVGHRARIADPAPQVP
jgi:replicative DNA helicase